MLSWFCFRILICEQQKTRPALVIQPNDLNTGLPQSIVAKNTSLTFRANHPSRVLMALNSSDGLQSGLLADSVVITDNLATVTELAVERVIGKISMQDVDQALRHTLGL